MKFTWGTGVVIFMLIFVSAIISFVIFAWNQDVNLVHQNYYEKGINYSDQVNTNKKSATFARLITAEDWQDSVRILLPMELAMSADSLDIRLFRPSDHNLDAIMEPTLYDSVLTFSKASLQPGRYIIKLSWITAGERFEVDKQIIIL